MDDTGAGIESKTSETPRATKRRVHEIAKTYKVRSKEVIGLLDEMGVRVRSASSQISGADVAALIAAHGSTLDELARRRAAEARKRVGAESSGGATRRNDSENVRERHRVSASAKPGPAVAQKKKPPRKKPKTSRLTKLAAKQNKRDVAYRAALGVTAKDLPKALGAAEGHGGAQPQVQSRRRATTVLPSRLAVSRKATSRRARKKKSR